MSSPPSAGYESGGSGGKGSARRCPAPRPAHCHKTGGGGSRSTRALSGSASPASPPLASPLKDGHLPSPSTSSPVPCMLDTSLSSVSSGSLGLAAPFSPTAPFPTHPDPGPLKPFNGLGGETALPRELLLQVLAFLRAWDLSALSLCCRQFSDMDLLLEAVSPMLSSYGILPSTLTSPSTGKGPVGLGLLLEGLRFEEVAYVHKALSAPEPLHGYLLSKAWANNHRRFAEALSSRRKASVTFAAQGGRRRSSSFRDRSNSDAVAPWHEVNQDITCEHGNLRPLSKGAGLGGSAGGMGGKRRVVDKKAWRAVRRFYLHARPFRTSAAECPVCLGKESAEKERLENEKRAREEELHAHPALSRLYDRRTGAPPRTSNDGLLPLDPGIYHLLPRAWLSSWRTYIRDPKAPRPRPPECCVLLCEAHGLPLIPPHVAEFLQAERKALLSNLSSRSGTVSEVLDTEEWDALTHLYPTDLSLKFSVDPEEVGLVVWSTAPCQRCDPCYDQAPVTVRNRQRKWSF